MHWTCLVSTSCTLSMLTGDIVGSCDLVTHGLAEYGELNE